MAWQKKTRDAINVRRKFNKYKHYSVKKKLQQEGRSCEEFEIMLNNLSLEEVIALKLELAAKAAGGMLYGLPIWYSINDIARDAVFKYSLSVTTSNAAAARLLGIDLSDFNKIKKKIGTNSFFED